MKLRLILLALMALALVQPAFVSASETNSVTTKAHLPAELENFLNNADKFTLFSLNPEPDFAHKSTNTFQHHVILGQVQIKRTTTKTSLIAALNDGIGDKEPDESGLPVPLPNCFNPRHGIRAKKGDETIEFLICFECLQIQVSSNKGKKWFFMTSNRPAATFNRVLKRNGVPLPKN